MERLVGVESAVEHVVVEADTAQTVGSGDVPVLATPRVVALVEAACVSALTGRLPAGRTSVGVRVVIDHVAATPVGRRVTAVARVADADGRRLGFEVRVLDGDEVAAEGRVERVVVDRERFVDRVVS